MAHLKFGIFFLLFFSLSKVKAQQSASISGVITDDKASPIESATVFINATSSITSTDKSGRFLISGLKAGNYEITVNMLGYSSYLGSVTIQSEPINLSIVLKEKQFQLSEVRIGPDRNKDNLKIFTKNFIGGSTIAKSCKILNPEVIDFSQKGKTLMASSDQFILIENLKLGYRLKYLLKFFQYNIEADVALYDGQVVFEEMTGSSETKKLWKKNRLVAYQGSLMHFLRSIFWNTTTKEGFKAQQYLTNVPGGPYDDPMDFITVERKSIKFDTLVNLIDSSFVSLKFNNLYVQHQSAKIEEDQNLSGLPERQNIPFGRKGSIIRLVANEAIIDSRGNYKNPETFYIYGHLARKRVGDQLPYDYFPDK